MGATLGFRFLAPMLCGLFRWPRLGNRVAVRQRDQRMAHPHRGRPRHEAPTAMITSQRFATRRHGMRYLASLLAAVCLVSLIPDGARAQGFRIGVKGGSMCRR